MLETMAAAVMSAQQQQQMPGWMVVVYLVVGIITLIAEFKLFAMAGEPAWAVIVPFYGAYVLFRILYGNGWKFLLIFVPILGTIVAIMMQIRMAQVYGRGTGFGVGLIFLEPIFLPILAFDGNSNYQGPRSDVFI